MYILYYAKMGMIAIPTNLENSTIV